MLIIGRYGLKLYMYYLNSPLDNPMRQVLLLLSTLAEDAKAQRKFLIIDLLKVRQEVADSGFNLEALTAFSTVSNPEEEFW